MTIYGFYTFILEIRILGVFRFCDFGHRGLTVMLVCFLSIHYLAILSPQSFYYLESFGLEKLIDQPLVMIIMSQNSLREKTMQSSHPCGPELPLLLPPPTTTCTTLHIG